MDSSGKNERAQEIVKNYVLISMGAGLVPIPILDIAAVTTVQLDMVKNLAQLYDADYSGDFAQNLLTTLTGSTLARAARACRQHGASAVYALATHGLFVDPASDTLASADISELVVTTTVPAFRLRGAAAAKLVQLDCSALLAAAIEYHCQGR